MIPLSTLGVHDVRGMMIVVGLGVWIGAGVGWKGEARAGLAGRRTYPPGARQDIFRFRIKGQPIRNV